MTSTEQKVNEIEEDNEEDDEEEAKLQQKKEDEELKRKLDYANEVAADGILRDVNQK